FISSIGSGAAAAARVAARGRDGEKTVPAGVRARPARAAPLFRRRRRAGLLGSMPPPAHIPGASGARCSRRSYLHGGAVDVNIIGGAQAPGAQLAWSHVSVLSDRHDAGDQIFVQDPHIVAGLFVARADLLPEFGLEVFKFRPELGSEGRQLISELGS